MSEQPPFPEVPEYLRRDPWLLDLVLVDICRAYLERGATLPLDAVPLLCERFVVYSEALRKALMEPATRPRGNPGQNSGRMVAALVGIDWKPGAAVAHIAEQTGQDVETVDKNYDRWKKRSEKRKNAD